MSEDPMAGPLCECGDIRRSLCKLHSSLADESPGCCWGAAPPGAGPSETVGRSACDVGSLGLT